MSRPLIHPAALASAARRGKPLSNITEEGIRDLTRSVIDEVEAEEFAFRSALLWAATSFLRSQANTIEVGNV